MHFSGELSVRHRESREEFIIKWEIFKDLEAPCSDISYQWISERDARLIVIMHFSRVIGGCNRDLELMFKHPIALQWEEESYDLIDLPGELPRCSGENFTSWTYPTLIIPKSEWADLYAARIYTIEEFEDHKMMHFSFISMNDSLHVLSEHKPGVKLIEANNA